MPPEIPLDVRPGPPTLTGTAGVGFFGMPKRVDPEVLSDAIDALTQGAPPHREPPAAPRPLWVQSLAVPARDVQPDLVARANRSATLAIQTFAPDCVELWRAMRLPGWDVLPTDPKRVDEILSGLERDDELTRAHWPEAKLAHDVYARVTARLARRSIQDLRVTFTGAGPATDHREEAVAVARALAIDADKGVLPEQITLELGSMSGGQVRRTLERLMAFVDDWGQHRKEPPPSLQITVDDASDSVVGALSPLLDPIERQVGWSLGTVGLEWRIDRPAELLSEARFPLSTSVSRGRLRSVRVEYERIATVWGVGVADLVLATTSAKLCETSLQLSAGRSRPIFDVEPDAISASDRAHRFAEVHEAWRRTAAQTRSLYERGVPWGTDEDPRQLAARWAATMTWARQSWPGLVDQLAEALLQCIDEPRPPAALLWHGQGLLTHLLRFVDADAVSPGELALAGVDAQDLAARSFALMVQRRRPT